MNHSYDRDGNVSLELSSKGGSSAASDIDASNRVDSDLAMAAAVKTRHLVVAELLADARKNAAEYVWNYDVGRGAE